MKELGPAHSVFLNVLNHNTHISGSDNLQLLSIRPVIQFSQGKHIPETSGARLNSTARLSKPDTNRFSTENQAVLEENEQLTAETPANDMETLPEAIIDSDMIDGAGKSKNKSVHTTKSSSDIKTVIEIANDRSDTSGTEGYIGKVVHTEPAGLDDADDVSDAPVGDTGNRGFFENDTADMTDGGNILEIRVPKCCPANSEVNTLSSHQCGPG